jgi:hypothetical protein
MTGLPWDGPRDGDPGGEGGDGAPQSASARRRNTVIAAFATVLYLALVVCAFGFVSLLADVDVVSRERTGGLVGPSMVATAVVVVLASLVREARRARGVTDRPVGWALLVGVGGLVGYVAAGTVLVAVESRSWFDGVVFASTTLASAFPYLAGALAAVVAGLFALAVASSGGGAPRWPWDRDPVD